MSLWRRANRAFRGRAI